MAIRWMLNDSADLDTMAMKNEEQAMRSEDIDEFVKRKPFEPFRITLTDGRSYDVHHPEYAMIGRSTVALGLPPAGQTHGFYDRLVTVSLLHIMELEPIAKSSSNSPSPN